MWETSFALPRPSCLAIASMERLFRLLQICKSRTLSITSTVIQCRHDVDIFPPRALVGNASWHWTQQPLQICNKLHLNQHKISQKCCMTFNSNISSELKRVGWQHIKSIKISSIHNWYAWVRWSVTPRINMQIGRLESSHGWQHTTCLNFLCLLTLPSSMHTTTLPGICIRLTSRCNGALMIRSSSEGVLLLPVRITCLLLGFIFLMTNVFTNLKVWITWTIESTVINGTMLWRLIKQIVWDKAIFTSSLSGGGARAGGQPKPKHWTSRSFTHLQHGLFRSSTCRISKRSAATPAPSEWPVSIKR